jgi:hypothetical protein
LSVSGLVDITGEISALDPKRKVFTSSLKEGQRTIVDGHNDTDTPN